MTAVSLALGAAAPAHAEDEALRKELEALRQQVAALQAEVNQIRAAPAAPAAQQQPVIAAAAASAPASAATAPTQRTVAEERGPQQAGGSDATRFWGYGELNYNHPTSDAGKSQADLRRAVLGFSHAFTEDTHVYGELEWEHAVTSADDQGESEVEQLYVEHRLNPDLAFRAGLTLIPLGLLNEHHEPTNYYGVERNFVETAIIPSTWREGGLSLLGSTDSGFSWNVGLTTSQNLRNWDPADPEGRISPLGAIHQELQLASARDVAIYGAANYQGVPGLTLGGGVFSGAIGQGDDGNFLASDSRATLGEVHARWQSGPFDLSALYTRGTISDTEKLNLTFIGNPYPVPKSFWGSYVQGAWRVWDNGQSSLAPFVRYEAFNTAASFESVPLGLGVPDADTERVWTVGVNYYLTPEVVFKADYQHFNITDELLGYGTRFDLGVGYQF
ncbi:MAG TPA: porin [Rhodanobacteraceae bacterium]|nr:porin [Rhodanobacteraceae bacterium]